MKVLLLGAGASRAAGYPLAGELLPAIEADAQYTRSVNLRDAWARWQTFRDSVRQPLRLLIDNPNPEVILSHLDLCEVAMDAHDDQHLGDAANAFQRGSTTPDQPQRYWNSAPRASLQEARAARNRLLDCVRAYFGMKHCDDGKVEHHARRDYLRQRLVELATGDVVITLNWDTTVERTLAEEGRWHPSSGYGFPKDLHIGTSPPLAGEARRAATPQASEISVLKLHGSTGWYSNRRGEAYFRHPSYLQCFSFPDPLVDPLEPQPGTGPPEDAILMYPSYLKRLTSMTMQTVWHCAAEALLRAQHVEIRGYSLPKSDTAVRVLLNSLRFRLAEQRVHVAVHDPTEEVRNRWAELLGPSAFIDAQTTG